MWPSSITRCAASSYPTCRARSISACWACSAPSWCCRPACGGCIASTAARDPSMPLDIHDTIVALSSAPGGGGRAIVRLSGPAALAVVNQVFTGPDAVVPNERRRYAGTVRLPDLNAPLPADLYVWPGPRSYTGQDVVELHTLGSPPLVELLVERLLGGGARAAQPGEFTLRAFLAGKLDLTRAEAILGVIEAGDRDELKKSLKQLAGGLSRPLDGLREDLLDLLADLEAGLDFADEDIQFIDKPQLLFRVARGME